MEKIANFYVKKDGNIGLHIEPFLGILRKPITISSLPEDIVAVEDVYRDSHIKGTYYTVPREVYSVGIISINGIGIATNSLKEININVEEGNLFLKEIEEVLGKINSYNVEGYNSPGSIIDLISKDTKSEVELFFRNEEDATTYKEFLKHPEKFLTENLAKEFKIKAKTVSSEEFSKEDFDALFKNTNKLNMFIKANETHSFAFLNTFKWGDYNPNILKFLYIVGNEKNLGYSSSRYLIPQKYNYYLEHAALLAAIKNTHSSNYRHKEMIGILRDLYSTTLEELNLPLDSDELNNIRDRVRQYPVLKRVIDLNCSVY